MKSNPLNTALDSFARKTLDLKEKEQITTDHKQFLAEKTGLKEESLNLILGDGDERLTPYQFQMMAEEAGYNKKEDFEKALGSLLKDDTFAVPFVEKGSINLFISYSHHPTDTLALERVRVHLAPLAKDGLDLWDDSKIQVGAKWDQEIKKALERAHAAILLVSADFLASSYITENELPPLLSNAKKNGVLIVPVIIKPCGFEDDENLAEFQALNSPNEPILGMTEIDQEHYWNKLRKIILEFVEDHPDLYQAKLNLPHKA